MRYILTAAVVASALALTGSPAAAQRAATGPTKEYVCGLMPKAEVEKTLGRKFYSDAEGMDLGGGATCDLGGGEAQVMLFGKPNDVKSWERVLQRFGHAQAKRTPVPGLGAAAYVIYPPPKNQYQETVAMVVISVPQGTLVVSSAVKKKGDAAETALAPTIALAKLVLPKLK